MLPSTKLLAVHCEHGAMFNWLWFMTGHVACAVATRTWTRRRSVCIISNWFYFSDTPVTFGFRKKIYEIWESEKHKCFNHQASSIQSIRAKQNNIHVPRSKITCLVIPICVPVRQLYIPQINSSNLETKKPVKETHLDLSTNKYFACLLWSKQNAQITVLKPYV